jgi:predicted O-methyltransferase YrrM
MKGAAKPEVLLHELAFGDRSELNRREFLRGANASAARVVRTPDSCLSLEQMMSEAFRSFVPAFGDPVGTVLDELYAATLHSDPLARQASAAQGITQESDSRFYRAMEYAYMPVTPAFGQLLYTLVRASGARRVVEFGTSFGVSTVFLAAALRANGGGELISTELIPAKAKQAARNLERADLRDLVEIREGDARTTLEGVTGPIDLLLLDGAKSLYLPILELLEPQLAGRGLVVSDNTDMQGAGGYLEYVRDPRNGYVTTAVLTTALGAQHGHEIAMRRWLNPPQVGEPDRT